jgi:hypothetical protein
MPWHGLSPADLAQMRGELLGDLLAATGAAPGGNPERDLTARDAAAIVGLTRPDGTPRDTFYDLAPQLGGYKVSGGWRFPRAGIEAFKRNGGDR